MTVDKVVILSEAKNPRISPEVPRIYTIAEMAPV